MLVQDSGNPALWSNPEWSVGEPGLFAVIIGVSRYPYLQGGASPAPKTYGLPQLAVSALTAYRFFEWLKDDYALPGCPLAQCRLLLSPTDPEQEEAPGLAGSHGPAGMDSCDRELNQWFLTLQSLSETAAAQSRSVFFFSGHGLELSTDEQILLPEDYLDPAFAGFDRALNTRNLFNALGRLPVRESFFFIDACRNDTEALRDEEIEGRAVLPARRRNQERRAAAPIFSAAAPGWRAFQHNDVTRGLSFFGTALLEGLRGAGSVLRESDPLPAPIRTNPLHEFLRGRVTELLRPYGPSVSQPVTLSGWASDAVITMVSRRPAAAHGAADGPTSRRAHAGGADAAPARDRGLSLAALESVLASAGEFVTDLLAGSAGLSLTLPEADGPASRSPADSDAARAGAARGLWEGACVFDPEREAWAPAGPVLQEVRPEEQPGGMLRVTFRFRSPEAPHWLRVGAVGEAAAVHLPADGGAPVWFRMELGADAEGTLQSLRAELAPEEGSLQEAAAAAWIIRDRRNPEAALADLRAARAAAPGDPAPAGGAALSPLSRAVAALIAVRTAGAGSGEPWLAVPPGETDLLPDLLAARAEYALRTGGADAVDEAAELLLALTARGLPYTADGLGLAAGLAGDLLGLLPAQDPRRARVEAARHTLRRALAATRPGGFFAVWKAPPNPLSPHHVPVFPPEERQP